MSSTPSPQRDDDEMGVQETIGVRQQLQAMVSDSLTTRGISTSDLWRPKPKTELTGEELTRLERQRANKRKWARKERARSRNELETLKQQNGNLEYENQQLRRDVDKLTQKKIHLRSALIDHQCHTLNRSPPVNQNPPVVHVVYFPVPRQKWASLADGEETMEADEGPSTSSSRRPNPHRLRLASDGEEEKVRKKVTPGLLRLKGTNFVIQNGAVRQILQHNQQSQKTLLATQRPTVIAATTTRHTDEPGTSQEDQQAGSSHEDDENQTNVMVVQQLYPTVTSTVSSNGREESQSLPSGGFTMSNLASSCGKSFMAMLQDNDDDVVMMGDDCATSTFVVPQVQTGSDNVQNESDSIVSPERTVITHEDVVMQETDFDDGNQDDGSEAKVPSTFVTVVTSSSAVAPQSENSQTWLEASGDVSSQNCDESDLNNFTITQRASDATMCRTAIKMTKKGALLNKWHAEEETGDSAKKPTMSSNPQNSSRKSARANFVNPWAVTSTVEANQETHFDSGNDSMVSAAPVITVVPADPVSVITSANVEILSSLASSEGTTTVTDTTTENTEFSVFIAPSVVQKREGDSRFTYNLTSNSRPTFARTISCFDDAVRSAKSKARVRHFSLPTSLADGNQIIIDDGAGYVFMPDEEVVDSIVDTSEHHLHGTVSQSKTVHSSEVAGAPEQPELRLVSAPASAVTLVVPEVPSSPSTPSSPAPSSPFHSRPMVSKITTSEEEVSRVKVELTDGSSTGTSWEFLCETPTFSGETEERRWQTSEVS